MSAFVRHPASVEEAVGWLASIPGALPISGGASLMAMINARLVEPSCLVNLERLEELRGLSLQADGSLRIGAMTRHRDIAGSALLVGAHVLLRQAAAVIANRPVRNMGTIGGALGHADPAADYLGPLRCLDAEIEIAGRSGRRSVPMSQFILGWYETALAPGEIVVAARAPPLPAGATLYRKVARVSGDFATISCALRLEEDGRGTTARAAIGACGPAPLRSETAEELLRGGLGDAEAVARFGAALQAHADPIDDVRGSADYRLKLIPRVLASAIAELTGADRG